MPNQDLNRDGRIDSQDLVLDRGNLVINTNFVRIQGTHISRHTGGEHHTIVTDSNYRKLLEVDKPSDRNRLLTTKMILDGIFQFTDWLSGKLLTLPDKFGANTDISKPESELNGARFVIREMGDYYRFTKGHQFRWQSPTNKSFRVGKAFYEAHVDPEHTGVERPTSQSLVNHVQGQLNSLRNTLETQTTPENMLRDEVDLTVARIDNLLSKNLDIPSELLGRLRQARSRLMQLSDRLAPGQFDDNSFDSVTAELKELRDLFNGRPHNKFNPDIPNDSPLNGTIDKSTLSYEAYREVQKISDRIAVVFDAAANDFIKQGSDGAKRFDGVKEVQGAFNEITFDDELVTADKYHFPDNIHEGWHFGHKYFYHFGHSATKRIGDKRAYSVGKHFSEQWSDGDEMTTAQIQEEFGDEIGFNLMDLTPGGADPSDPSITQPSLPETGEINDAFEGDLAEEPFFIHPSAKYTHVDPNEFAFRFDRQMETSVKPGQLQQQFANVPSDQTFTQINFKEGPSESVTYGHVQLKAKNMKTIRKTSKQILNGLTITDKRGPFFSDTHGLFSDINMTPTALRKNVNMEGLFLTTMGEYLTYNVDTLISKNFDDTFAASLGSSHSRNTNKTTGLGATSIGSTGVSNAINAGPGFSLGGATSSLGLFSLSVALSKLVRASKTVNKQNSTIKQSRYLYVMDRASWPGRKPAKKSPAMAGADKNLKGIELGSKTTNAPKGVTGFFKGPHTKLGMGIGAAAIAGSVGYGLYQARSDKALHSSPDNSRLKEDDFSDFTSVNPNILDGIHSLNSPLPDAPVSDMVDSTDEDGSLDANFKQTSDKKLSNKKQKFLLAAGAIAAIAALFKLTSSSAPPAEDDAEDDFSYYDDIPAEDIYDDNYEDDLLDEALLSDEPVEAYEESHFDDEPMPEVDDFESSPVGGPEPESPADVLFNDENSDDIVPSVLLDSVPIVPTEDSMPDLEDDFSTPFDESGKEDDDF